MRLPDFDYARPRSLAEACALLGAASGGALAIAGGTDLLGAVKRGLRTPERLVDLQGIPGLDTLEATPDGGLRVGALVTLRRLSEEPVAAAQYPLLADAARAVGSPQLRAMGTVGGNLCQDSCCVFYQGSVGSRGVLGLCRKAGGEVCHAVKGSRDCWATYMGDLAPALLALGAIAAVAGPGVERTIPLRELYSGDGLRPQRLGRGEIVAEVRLPPPLPRSGGAYLKLRRRQAIDYPLLGVAVHLALEEGEGVVAAVEIELTGADRAPLAVPEAELLLGKPLSAEVLEEVATAAFRRARPVANAAGLPPSYRKEMARVLVRRGLNLAHRRALSPGTG